MINGANTTISVYRLLDSGTLTVRNNQAVISSVDAYMESVSPELAAVLGEQAGSEMFDCYVEPGDYRINDLVIDHKQDQYFIMGIERHENNDDTDDLYALKLHRKTDQYNTNYSVKFPSAVNSNISVPYAINLNGSDWSFTMIARINKLVRQIGGVYDDSVLLAQQDGTGVGRSIISMQIQTGGILFGYGRLGTFLQGFGRPTRYDFVEGEWVHIAMTYNLASQTLKFYADAELVGEFMGVVPEVASGNLIIGTHKSGTINLTDGNVAQFRVFTGEVTEDEVKQWYDRSIRPNKPLQVEYLFKGGSGTFVEDTSGNGRHGTVNGTASYVPDSPFAIGD